ncbi:hypothetical protein IF2G_00909 [Cordyceps javanica]|nr:hypothetical protein IF2G_00909 [Cordyceps javanica]
MGNQRGRNVSVAVGPSSFAKPNLEKKIPDRNVTALMAMQLWQLPRSNNFAFYNNDTQQVTQSRTGAACEAKQWHFVLRFLWPKLDVSVGWTIGKASGSGGCGVGGLDVIVWDRRCNDATEKGRTPEVYRPSLGTGSKMRRASMCQKQRRVTSRTICMDNVYRVLRTGQLATHPATSTEYVVPGETREEADRQLQLLEAFSLVNHKQKANCVSRRRYSGV